ncbi:hypothetical protein ACX0G9_12225 [Flavitalea flava]
MERALEELSATVLRNLLIEEIKIFIVALDCRPTEELQSMKYRLRRIFDLIAEKEQAELRTLVWGKNSTNTSGTNPQTRVDEIINNLR